MSFPTGLEAILETSAYYERKINERMDKQLQRPNLMKFLVTSPNGESHVFFEELEVGPEPGDNGLAEICGRPDQAKVGDTLEVLV
jgi:hypothetical protein